MVVFLVTGESVGWLPQTNISTTYVVHQLHVHTAEQCLDRCRQMTGICQLSFTSGQNDSNLLCLNLKQYKQRTTTSFATTLKTAGTGLDCDCNQVVYAMTKIQFMQKGVCEMCNFCMAASKFLRCHGIKTRTHACGEMVHFPTRCIIRIWKALQASLFVCLQ